jgi:Protein of unknown function (DUF1593)
MSLVNVRRVCLSGGWPATMRLLLIVGLALHVCSSGERASAAPTRPRVPVLSDFPPLDVIPVGAGHGPAEKRSDPDDIQSMVRFLLYTNEFDVEGLVASAATVANVARKQHILDILNLYDQVDEKLRRLRGRDSNPDNVVQRGKKRRR